MVRAHLPRVVAGLVLLVAVPIIFVATPNLAGRDSTTAFAISLGILLLGLVVAIGGLWIRRTESLLTILLLLLLLVPQNYVLVGPLRSVGNPSLLWSLLALLLWGASRLLGIAVPRPGHPARWALLFFVVAACAAYAAGMMRPLTDIEDAGSTRVVFPVLGMVGVALLACDGLTRVGLDRLLQRLVYIAGVAAGVGILEFFDTAFSYRAFAKLPGLTTNTELISDTRAGFVRVMGAAAHPIEYSVALAVVAPLALHFTLHGATRWSRQLSGLSLALVLAVTPMSVSRSGVVVVLGALFVYGLHLTGRARANLLVLGLIGAGLMSVTVPRLLGTLRSLFFIGEDDPSIKGRTVDYAKIPALLDGHWWFGRGLGTFQPSQYFFLDNAYLGMLLEGGLVLLSALVLLLLTGMALARGARKASSDPATRSLGAALLASFLGLALAAATFDEIGFRQTGFLLFLLLGCTGALWTLTRADRRGDPAARPLDRPGLADPSTPEPVDARVGEPANASGRAPALGG